MANSGDGMPRSENRKRCKLVGVRLTPEEYLEIAIKVDELNKGLGPDHSKSAMVTVSEYLATAALRREFRMSPAAVMEVPPEDAKALATLASLGNLFKAWLEHGDAVLTGKNPNRPIKVLRSAEPPERAAVISLIRELTEAAKRLRKKGDKK